MLVISSMLFVFLSGCMNCECNMDRYINAAREHETAFKAYIFYVLPENEWALEKSLFLARSKIEMKGLLEFLQNTPSDSYRVVRGYHPDCLELKPNTIWVDGEWWYFVDKKTYKIIYDCQGFI